MSVGRTAEMVSVVSGREALVMFVSADGEDPEKAIFRSV